jgi:Chaperone of endosialidase
MMKYQKYSVGVGARGISVKVGLFVAPLLLLHGMSVARVNEVATSYNSLVDASPNVLLPIEKHRASVVDKIVTTWKNDLTANQQSSLRARLMGLRSDELLAASALGTLDGVLELATNPESIASSTNASRVGDQSKAVGETARDLVYTPVIPCRFFDTRNAVIGSKIAANTSRDFDVISSSFQSQGGVASNCGIDPGASAIAINYAVVGQIGQGFAVFYPAGTSLPPASSVNFPSETVQYAEASFGIFPICTSNCPGGNEITVFSSETTHVLADVVGYFMPPSRTGNGLRVIQTTGTFVDAPITINGSASNSASGQGATVLGGGSTSAVGCTGPGGVPISCANSAVGEFSLVGGGRGNRVADVAAVVLGGQGNFAGSLTTPGAGRNATVLAGEFNSATGPNSTIVGGRNAEAIGAQSVVVGGDQNVATGDGSVVSGGSGNNAVGANSWAGGRRAKSLAGAFVWADNSSPVEFSSVANEFAVRSTGGARFVTGSTGSGVSLAAGAGSWTTLSDHASKTAFESINSKEILNKLMSLPIATWQYKSQDKTIRHIGPVSQDFKALFGVGETEKGIATVDADGIALAAIQGLGIRLKERDAKIDSLSRENKRLQTELNIIKKKLGL